MIVGRFSSDEKKGSFEGLKALDLIRYSRNVSTGQREGFSGKEGISTN